MLVYWIKSSFRPINLKAFHKGLHPSIEEIGRSSTKVYESIRLSVRQRWKTLEATEKAKERRGECNDQLARGRAAYKAGTSHCEASHSCAFRGFKVEVKVHLSVHRLKFWILRKHGNLGTLPRILRLKCEKSTRDKIETFEEVEANPRKAKQFYLKS